MESLSQEIDGLTKRRRCLDVGRNPNDRPPYEWHITPSANDVSEVSLDPRVGESKNVFVVGVLGKEVNSYRRVALRRVQMSVEGGELTAVVNTYVVFFNDGSGGC